MNHTSEATIKCKHPDYDDSDICLDCGEEVQMYTSCCNCEWFGIPIIDSGAPEYCNKCLAAEIERYQADLASDDLSASEREEIQDALDEAEDDLDFFFDRQECLDESERRYNDGEVAA